MATQTIDNHSIRPLYGLDPETDAVVTPDEDYLRSVVLWTKAAYDEAKYQLGQSDDISKIGRYIDYLRGKHWGSGRPSYRAAPVDNRIWRLVWETVALLTDIRPVFEVKTYRKEYLPQQETLNKLVRGWWMMNDVDTRLASVILYAELGLGYGSMRWNPVARNGKGDIELIPISPQDVLPLKIDNTFENSQVVIYQCVKPLSWFRERFPLRGELVRPDAQLSRYSQIPSPAAPIGYTNMSPAMQRVLRGAITTVESNYPAAIYREFWIDDYSRNETNKPVLMGRPKSNWSYIVQPTERLYPRGRLILMGGDDCPLDDQPNPYWHGRKPFTPLRLNVTPWQYAGPSDFLPLTPLQDVTNSILAGVLDCIRKAVNPGFYGPRNAFSEEVWNKLDWSMPGAKAAFNPNIQHVPGFAQPPQLPSYVMQALTFVTREMDSTSGLSAAQQAAAKRQMPSADALDRMRESLTTPLRLKFRNVEVFLRDIGEQFISNAFQFLNDKRRFFMLGEKGMTFEDFDYDPGTMVPAGVPPNEFAQQFTFLIQPGSLIGVNRTEKALLALRLRQMGDLDRKHLYEFLDVGINSEEVEKELKREAQEGVPMHPMTGKQQRASMSARQKA